MFEYSEKPSGLLVEEMLANGFVVISKEKEKAEEHKTLLDYLKLGINRILH
jgi:molybdopterin biosynthesis enzyme